MTPSTAGAESGSIGETTRTPTVTPGASFCGTVLPLAGSKDPLLLAIDPLRERASNFAGSRVEFSTWRRKSITYLDG